MHQGYLLFDQRRIRIGAMVAWILYGNTKEDKRKRECCETLCPCLKRGDTSCLVAPLVNHLYIVIPITVIRPKNQLATRSPAVHV